MAVVKSRTGKRSSSSGYSSTLTTIIFVSLCVLGVWMLSSDKVAPPKSTNRSAAATASIHSSSSVPDEERESPDPEPTTKTNQPAAYADSQGDLPEDAIKVDGITEANHDDHKESASSSEVSNDSGEVTSSTDTVTEVANDEGSDKKEQDTGQENDASTEGNGETKDEGEQNTGTEDKKVDDAQASEESTQTPEQESKETKENQSEDSGGTEQPGDDQGTNPPQSVLEETKGEDSGGNQSQQSTTDNDQVEEEGPKENSDHVISDDDQQKRLEQHHQQKDDQMQQAEKQSQNETHEATIHNEENQKVAKQDIDQKEKASMPVVKDSFPDAGDNSGIPKESKDSKKSWATQADQSENEKERRNVGTGGDKKTHTYGYEWQLCNVTAGADYIPCLDNEKAIAKLRSRKHYEHRERHCPEEAPSCLVQLPLQPCMHRAPTEENVRGSEWPEKWPRRLQTPPYWLNRSQMGIYGKPAPEDFAADYEHWKHVVSKMYLSGLGISWSDVRNIMDMRAVYGGFAAALKDLKVWVMNVVNVDSPDTLPIIYERGLIGIYHDWCESFSTYPRTYDLLHADHLFSRLKKRCKLVPVLAEVDRVTRPGGKLIVRDDSTTMDEVENLLKSLHWEVHLTFSKNQEGILSAQKTNWRPDTHVAYS